MPKKLKILYDPQIFDIQNYGGITRYFSNLIRGIEKTSDFIAELPLVYSTNCYVQNFPQSLRTRFGKLFLKRKYNRRRWNLFFAKGRIKKADFDILHATYYDPYFLENLKKPLVITVHDMIYENYRHLFKDADVVISNKKTVIESADLIIAISEFTKQELLRYYPHLADKISVVYHGLPDTDLIAAKESLPEKYLLYVGDRYALYKNFNPLVSAISPIINKEGDLHLICAGGGEFNTEELDLLEKSGILKYTTQINASDSQILQLYQNALIFMYPSLEEGFGLPILEAFRSGCPIACSNTSCLPEVGGDAVSYFDPIDINSIHQTISTLIDDPVLRAKRVNAGYERIKKFTFRRCLEQTLNCYKSLIQMR